MNSLFKISTCICLKIIKFCFLFFVYRKRTKNNGNVRSKPSFLSMHIFSQFASISYSFHIFFSLSLHSCLLSLLKPSLSPLIPPRFSISTLPLRSLQIIPYRDSSNSHFISPNTSLLTKIPSSLLTHTHLLSHLNLFPFSKLTPFQCE